MKRIVKKTTALLCALMILCTVCLVGASAAGTGYVNGGTTSFEKFLTMKSEANVPNTEFKFSIAPSTTEIPATFNLDGSVKTPTVYKGNDSSKVSGTPTITSSVKFAVGDTTYDTVQSGDAISLDGGKTTFALESGEKYAKKTITVDFTGVEFKEPGIYRYIITEAQEDYATAKYVDGITNDANPTRYCDVYVHQKTTSDALDLEIAGYSIHEGNEVIYKNLTDYNTLAALEELAELKDNGFENKYDTWNLTVKKIITGNQGFKNKYFTMVLTISNAVAGTRYDVDLSKVTDASSKELASGIKSDAKGYYLVADADGTVTYTFKLSNKNGVKEEITVYGLTANTKYTVTEDREDYEPSNTVVGETTEVNSGAEAATVAVRSMGKADNTVTFTNDRNGTVPTAYIVEFAPYVMLIAITVAGATLLLMSKKRKTAIDAE